MHNLKHDKICNKIPNSELIGKTFNYLKCLRYEYTNEVTQKRHFLFECLLCGNKKIIDLMPVIHNNTKSCGCLTSKTAKLRHQQTRKLRLQEAIGQKYNYLLILDTYYEKKHYRCKCRCDCGKIFHYRLDRIKSGDKKSCGCKTQRKQRTRFQYFDSTGYCKIYCPDHHKADTYGFVHEHVVIMENYLGKKIKNKEVVHHNEDRGNNDISNLRLFKSQKEHMRWHFLIIKLQSKYLTKALNVSMKENITTKEKQFINLMLNKWRYKDARIYHYKGLGSKKKITHTKSS